MKANRAFRRDDDAGPEIVGAIILFGIFVGVIAFMNATAVPNAGHAAEQEHYDKVLADLNTLQSQAEVASIPGSVGATIAQAIALGPSHSTAKDFFSYFLADPALASGELTLTANYGNVTVTHHHGGSPNPITDLGSTTAQFPYGKLSFDPHPIFRESAQVRLETGGVIASSSNAQNMRYSPPITVSTSGADTFVTINVRVLNGTDFNVGGVAPVRVSLGTEAATLASTTAANAADVTMRLETEFGPAWGRYLNATSDAAGLAAGSDYVTTVTPGSGGALDVVTWTVNGLSGGTNNDVRLTTGLAIFRVSAS